MAGAKAKLEGLFKFETGNPLGEEAEGEATVTLSGNGGEVMNQYNIREADIEDVYRKLLKLFFSFSQEGPKRVRRVGKATAVSSVPNKQTRGSAPPVKQKSCLEELDELWAKEQKAARSAALQRIRK